MIRRWYAQLPEIVSTADGLTENAEASVAAFKEGNLSTIGQHLSTYWTQKKCMAEGCEPRFVTKIMEAWRPHVHGWSLAGAGGGGFMVLLTREPDAAELLKKVLTEKTEQSVEELKFCTVDIDTEGMAVSFEDAA